MSFETEAEASCDAGRHRNSMDSITISIRSYESMDQEAFNNWPNDPAFTELGALSRTTREEPYGRLNPKWTKWMHRMCCP